MKDDFLETETGFGFIILPLSTVSYKPLPVPV